jgi:hypothetical protein
MSRFSIENSIPLTSDGLSLDVFTAKFRDIRYILPVQTNITVDASSEANLPYLADKYLQDQDLWWVILMFNGLVDPIEDVTIGTTLRIPDKRSLTALLELVGTTKLTSVIL